MPGVFKNFNDSIFNESKFKKLLRPSKKCICGLAKSIILIIASFEGIKKNFNQPINQSIKNFINMSKRNLECVRLGSIRNKNNWNNAS